MLQTLGRFAGFDLRQQLTRLRWQAEELKDRAIQDVKHQVAATGITIGLAFSGLVFLLITVVIALIALFFWAEMRYGTFAAFGIVGGTTAALALLLFAIAGSRGGKSKPERPPELEASSDPEFRRAPPPSASFAEAASQRFVHRTAAATDEVLDSAAEIVRKGPREAILATLAVAAVVGLVIGRRR
jgi:uncharacterized membrane protein YbhN (UPF0104 family)